MADLSISGFWKNQFVGCSAPSGAAALAGWETILAPIGTFVEPLLARRSGFEISESRLWLIAAPGAVGKSTLANQMAAQLNLALVDLSRASTIGGNYLSGGLVHTKLIAQFESGRLGIVIDALDEALLRVNSAGFEDFIADIARVARENGPPIILLGREGVIDDAWTRLINYGLVAPIVDILRFDKSKAREFVKGHLRQKVSLGGATKKRLESYFEIYLERADELIERLAAAAGESSTIGPMAFAGYAPVLQAVAEYVGGLENPHSAASEMGADANLIETIIDQILEREAKKIVDGLVLKHPSVAALPLYSPREQRVRLLAKLTGEKLEIEGPTLASDVAQDYEAAIEQLLPQHPFLDGTGLTTSSAVFEADLLFYQLVDDAAGNGGIQWASHSKPGNPFLVDIYRQRISTRPNPAIVPPEHLGLLFASVQALAEAGEEAEFRFEQGDDGESAIVDMDLHHANEETSDRKSWEFESSVAGKITFLGAIGNVSVVGPVDVIIGDSQSGARVTAPADIDCSTLEIKGGELAIAAASTARRSGSSSDSVAVSLVAERLDGDSVLRVSLFGKVGLHVEWPNAKRHPWAPYASESKLPKSPQIGDARLALRRLVVSFRSHSKGRLARYHKKIEHRRMTKGELGTLVREALLDAKVLSLEGSFYFLDPDALGKVVQTNYADIFQKRFSEGVDTWLEKNVLE